MGLDSIDIQAISEGQALSDVRRHIVDQRRSNNKRYRYRTQESEFNRSDKGWAALVRKARAQELAAQRIASREAEGLEPEIKT